MTLFRNILFVALTVLLMGCSHIEQPMGKPLPTLNYESLMPYSIHGGGVLIQQSFRPTAEMQKLETEFSVAPDDLIQLYANKRFQTNVSPVKLVFDIQKAALSKVSDEDNLVGFLSGAAEDYYKLDIFIAMTPVRADGQRVSPFTIKSSRQLLIPQNSSLAEREFRQFEMLEKMMIDIDRTISDMVQNKMTSEYF